MTLLQNDRILRTIKREPVDRTPIWIMRQAGRYLPEYRKTRERAGSFMHLCKTPELACEVTLQPLKRFDLDAAIIFSDILTIPDAMGLGLNFAEGRGPYFSRSIRNDADVQQLMLPDQASLQYVYDAIRLVQSELHGRIPLIGFAGSPWTISAYMIEGESRDGFPLAFKMMRENPALLHQLLALLSEAIIAHLRAQMDAGVQLVMIFDTWGGMLPKDEYERFSLYYMSRIITALKKQNQYKDVPIILFTKGGHLYIEKIAQSGCDVIGVDSQMSLDEARKKVGSFVALQGNLDPQCLLHSPEKIELGVRRILNAYGQGPGHIFNLGHGITPDVPPERVAVLVDAVHRESEKLHRHAIHK